jgi:hypothetical protein
MWMIITLLALVGVMAFFVFFWSPDETDVTVAAASPVTSGLTSVTFHPPTRPLRFDSEKKWYGISFHGYEDEYSFSTTKALDKARESVRSFFINKNAEVVFEDGRRLIFWRGWDFYKLLVRGHDTGSAQLIEISLHPGDDLTKISILYRVSGWQFRTPPNQLRREAMKLHTQLVGVEYGRVR